tara:strand:+ start:84 stop:350 length:267 start_codon:yes stop_codon:yes gene_type:complete
MDNFGDTTKQEIFTLLTGQTMSINSSKPIEADVGSLTPHGTTRMSYSFVRNGQGSPSTSPVTPQVLQQLQQPGESLLSLVERLSNTEM